MRRISCRQRASTCDPEQPWEMVKCCGHIKIGIHSFAGGSRNAHGDNVVHTACCCSIGTSVIYDRRTSRAPRAPETAVEVCYFSSGRQVACGSALCIGRGNAYATLITTLTSPLLLLGTKSVHVAEDLPEFYSWRILQRSTSSCPSPRQTSHL